MNAWARAALFVLLSLNASGCATLGEATNNFLHPPNALARKTRNVGLVMPGGGWLHLNNQNLFRACGSDCKEIPELPGWMEMEPWWAPVLTFWALTAAGSYAVADGISRGDARQTNIGIAGLVAVRLTDAFTATHAAVRYREKRQEQEDRGR